MGNVTHEIQLTSSSGVASLGTSTLISAQTCRVGTDEKVTRFAVVGVEVCLEILQWLTQLSFASNQLHSTGSVRSQPSCTVQQKSTSEKLL